MTTNQYLLTVLLDGVSVFFDPYVAVALNGADELAVELFALILGGIGIFLTGIHFAGSHFQKITGGTFQHLIARISESRLGVFLGGIFLGLFTQSGKATAFILSDFVQADMIKPRRCAPVVFWGNAGSSLIVFASMLSLKVIALMILGVTALGTAFNIPKRLLNAYRALFGLALVMYGLYLVKAGSAGFAGYDEIQRALDYLGEFTLLAFALGCVLTLLVQSNLAIMMITIALAAGGILTLEKTAMVMYGAQAGTGLLTCIFSSHTHGRARQVVICQIAFDILATSSFVALFYLESWTGMPLVLALARLASEVPGTQAVILALVFQFGAAVIALQLRSRIFDYIEPRFPPSATEVLSAMVYLHRNAADSPETGLILADKEQMRLLRRLPNYIDYLRAESGGDEKHSPDLYHAAYAEIGGRIGDTLSEISGHSLSQSNSDYLIKVTKIQEQLNILEDIVFRLTRQLARHDLDTKAGALGKSIMESVDFIILAAIDAIDSKDDSEIDTLAMFTRDRTEMMTRLRRNYFNSEQELTREERNFILDITILFESAVQTLARYGAILKST